MFLSCLSSDSSFSGSTTPSYVNGFCKGDRLTIKMNHLRLGRVHSQSFLLSVRTKLFSIVCISPGSLVVYLCSFNELLFPYITGYKVFHGWKKKGPLFGYHRLQVQIKSSVKKCMHLLGCVCVRHFRPRLKCGWNGWFHPRLKCGWNFADQPQGLCWNFFNRAVEFNRFNRTSTAPFFLTQYTWKCLWTIGTQEIMHSEVFFVG